MGEGQDDHEWLVMRFELLLIALKAKTAEEETERARACLRRYVQVPPRLEDEVRTAISRRHRS